MPEARNESAVVRTDLVYLRRTLGAYLRNAREGAGISLRELERRTGVSNSEIHKVEAGNQECRLESFIKITAALGIPPGRVVDEVVTSDCSFYGERILENVAFLKLTEKYVDLRGVLSVNIGAIASWAAHLTRCSNPMASARSADYPGGQMRSAFIRFAEVLEAREKSAFRRSTLAALSADPITALGKVGLFDGKILAELLGALVSPNAAEKAHLGRSLSEVLGLPLGGLLWVPFMPFGGLAVADPSNVRVAERVPVDAAASKSLVDRLQYIEYLSPVPITWKKLKARLKTQSCIPGKKAAMARAADVNQSSVNSWLDDDREPGAEATLRLLEWVTAEEARQQSAIGKAPAPSQPAAESKSKPIRKKK